MSVRLDVRYCNRCKGDRVVEVETLSIVQVETATCQTCGHVQTEEVEGRNVQKK